MTRTFFRVFVAAGIETRMATVAGEEVTPIEAEAKEASFFFFNLVPIINSWFRVMLTSKGLRRLRFKFGPRWQITFDLLGKKQRGMVGVDLLITGQIPSDT